MVARKKFFIASTAISAPYELYLQNHESGRVLVGQGDPTIIIVLNGKIIHMEQIWL
jgi:hypothetical protein